MTYISCKPIFFFVGWMERIQVLFKFLFFSAGTMPYHTHFSYTQLFCALQLFKQELSAVCLFIINSKYCKIVFRPQLSGETRILCLSFPHFKKKPKPLKGNLKKKECYREIQVTHFKEFLWIHYWWCQNFQHLYLSKWRVYYFASSHAMGENCILWGEY